MMYAGRRLAVAIAFATSTLGREFLELSADSGSMSPW